MIPIEVLYSFFPIRGLIAVAWILVGLAVLFVVFKTTKGGAIRLWVSGFAVATFAAPFAWSAYMEWKNLRDFREVYQQFQALCYEKAFQRIVLQARTPKLLVFSPPSNIKGAYGTELFYGYGQPKEWGRMKATGVRPTAPEEGTYEVSYTHLLEERVISGTPFPIHGVRQEVVEVLSGKTLGERVNYRLGNNFDGGEVCLDIEWFKGGISFVEQVVGPRYFSERDPSQYPWPKPVEHLKARLVSADNVDVQLRDYAQTDILPPGSEYDYNKREIRLPSGRFRMVEITGGSPLPIVAVVDQPNRYVFVLLPHADRNRPPREILFNYRSKRGELLKDIFVQIPPGMLWIDGWGIDPKDVRISEVALEFDLLGAKDRVHEYSDQKGRYTKRYKFQVTLPGES